MRTAGAACVGYGLGDDTVQLAAAGCSARVVSGSGDNPLRAPGAGAEPAGEAQDPAGGGDRDVDTTLITGPKLSTRLGIGEEDLPRDPAQMPYGGAAATLQKDELKDVGGGTGAGC